MTALGGYDVIVQDINEEATDLARFEMIDGRWGMKASVQKGKITYQACEDAIPRLTTTLDQADLADCDLIIEAVPCAPPAPPPPHPPSARLPLVSSSGRAWAAG